MKETWYFLDTEYNSPEFNMALDEALLRWHSEGDIPPVLRFYCWSPAALSVGYFQKIDGKIDVNAVKEHGFQLVRRLTGGRAVLHDDELTYSVIVSEKHEKMPNSVTEAYRVISQGILRGFQNLHLDAEFSIPEGKLTQTGSAVCFDQPSWYELVVAGRKAAGSAQTRQKGVILQHGSIPLEVDEDKLFDLFVYPNERVKSKAKQAFGNKAVAINDISPVKRNMNDLRLAFKRGFEEGLNINFVPFELSSEQLKEVHKLMEEKYGNDDWTFKRNTNLGA
ncbi:lipoate--protein ligase family protein [Salirhabdus salicampi]|uniref:lipoate--protein ligase family protein n=1 Tax=Salirhabdus salicampi TaxID=476102 RepID=UPI0020C26F4F|nr:biotin/lipoate A/B protein ligase family protein [Salirhabdus salicampi]MCP8617366.1 lipoate--protein ligase family protein [Salirhabdus salicampi]